MTRPTLLALLLALASVAPSVVAADPPKLELKDGDRIVYLGNAFAERDANYGYFEALLTIAHPDIRFTFRNLGWSGDTVWGDARARFGTRADGFQHLKDHVFALKPTVILVAYGMNESFAGEAGLPEFEKGLNTLLDTLAETKAKIVLISPIPHENLRPPLPDPAKHNADLARYREVLTQIAKERSIPVVLDFAKSIPPSMKTPLRLTDDGLLPSASGYALLALTLLNELEVEKGMRSIKFDDRGEILSTEGWVVTDYVKFPNGVKFQAVSSSHGGYLIPSLRLAQNPGQYFSWVEFVGLPLGRYQLRIDGQLVTPYSIADGTIRAFIRGGSECDQMNALRAAINKKNELYFHRWRPQNETYLFGFRKHEQGNNAAEIPLFDPLVAEQEEEIARLKKPVAHTYELIRDGDGK